MRKIRQTVVACIHWMMGKSGPFAGIVNRRALVYWEHGRRMTVAGEMLMDGFEIYVSSIVCWDDSNGELISEAERQRILLNIERSLSSQGVRIVRN